MTHNIRDRVGWLGLCFCISLGLWLCASLLGGCDYSTPATPSQALAPAGESPSGQLLDQGVLLDNIIRLIQTAALKPGGDNFAIATKNLNQYFSAVPAEQYQLDASAREYLLQQMPAGAVKELETPGFHRPDARHLEDCMLYQSIARRVGGVGDDLSRTRRVFGWIVEQIQLVPVGSLAVPELGGQAYARPYDVLMRGMATETEGGWAERAWLFMVLCRQLGVDVGLLTYTPAEAKETKVWICAALIEGKLYLFDTRIGLEIAGPGGTGVATLDDVLRDPSVLGRLDLPGLAHYETDRAALLASSSKIGILLDSSPEYRSPRMALLQRSLAGKHRTILYRDPAQERDGFAQALGAHAGTIRFWELPATVEALLFNNPRFVDATLRTLVLFSARYPLVYARIKQLRGDFPEAIHEYVTFRFVSNGTFYRSKELMPREDQQALDVYATYFLGLCHLEQGHTELARRTFEQTLKLLPDPGPGQPSYNMFRRGAEANLGRICAAAGDRDRAIAYLSQPDPTWQHHGNLLTARDLLWLDPTAPAAPELPPAPIATKIPYLLAAPPTQ